MVKAKTPKIAKKTPKALAAKPATTDPNADRDTITLVKGRYQKARNYRTAEIDPVWQRSYNNWQGKLDASKFPWRSKLFIPWSFTVVESIIPKVFARDPKWRAISRSPDDSMMQDAQEPQTQGRMQISTPDQATVVQNLLSYQWSRAGMRLKMHDYIKDALMYSKGMAKVSWNFKTKTTTVMEPQVDPDTDEITFIERKTTQIEHDDPQVDIIDPFDLYIDPDATTAGYGGDNQYLIHRKTVPLKDVKNNTNYKNVEKIKGKSSTVDQYEDKQIRFGNAPEQDPEKELVEILEYWECDRLVVIANREVVLRDTPNPFAHKQIPFVELDDYRDPHKLYGQSELSVIDPLQREINSIRNQRRDYDNLALNPVVRMIPGTLRNPNSARMAPGSMWLVSDLNSMDVFELPQLQGSAVQVEQQTAQDIKMSVALDEIGIGLLPEGSSRRSATEVVTAQSMAGKRFAMKIALLEEAVRKIGQLIFALDQQFLDQERIIQIVGEQGAKEWVKLGPDDVRGDFFIELETGSMLPKDEIAARQEAVQLLQYLNPIIQPVAQTNPAIILPIVRMVIDTFDMPNKQEIIDDLKQALMGAQQQVQAQQQAQNNLANAQAAGAVAQAQQPAQDSSGASQVQVPDTLQGVRADNELSALLGK
jgi:hypothetical protein